MSQQDNFFHLDDSTQGLQRELSPGLVARIFVGDQAMLSVVEVEPHTAGKAHRHPQEQWGVLLAGSGVRHQGGEQIEVRQGDFWRTPGNVPHSFTAGGEGATLLDVFSPPREEYTRAGQGFGPGTGPVKG